LPGLSVRIRDPSDAVRFIALNPLATKLLSMIRYHQPIGGEALACLAGPEQYKTYLAAGKTPLADLRTHGALLGTWREK
jgi:hypothetical protein